MGADPIDDERPQQKPQASLEVAVPITAFLRRVEGGGHYLVLSCVGGIAIQATLPPAASIAAFAPFVATMPVNLTAFSSLPVLMTLTVFASDGTSPAAFSASMSISVTGSFARSDKRISAVSFFDRDTKPRFGKRRCNGIWPPSKPTLWNPPERDFWPLCPRPAVLPSPEPMPRPARRRAFLAPAAGLIVLSRMM